MSVEDWLPPFDSDLANDSCDLNRSLAAFPGNGWSTSEPVFAEMRCHAKTLTVQGQSADRIRRPRHHAADPEQLYESFNSTPESSQSVSAFALHGVDAGRPDGTGALASANPCCGSFLDCDQERTTIDAEPCQC